MGNLNCKCNEEAIQYEPEIPESNLPQEKVKIPHISNLKQSFHNNINISPTLYSTYESENSMIKSSRKSFGSISDIDETNKSHIVSSRCLSKSSYQMGHQGEEFSEKNLKNKNQNKNKNSMNLSQKNKYLENTQKQILPSTSLKYKIQNKKSKYQIQSKFTNYESIQETIMENDQSFLSNSLEKNSQNFNINNNTNRSNIINDNQQTDQQNFTEKKDPLNKNHFKLNLNKLKNNANSFHIHQIYQNSSISTDRNLDQNLPKNTYNKNQFKTQSANIYNNNQPSINQNINNINKDFYCPNYHIIIKKTQNNVNFNNNNNNKKNNDDNNNTNILKQNLLLQVNQEFVYKPKITEAFLQARNDFKKSNGYAETPAPFLEKDFKSTSSLFQRRKLFEKKLNNLQNQK